MSAVHAFAKASQSYFQDELFRLNALDQALGLKSTLNLFKAGTSAHDDSLVRFHNLLHLLALTQGKGTAAESEQVKGRESLLRADFAAARQRAKDAA